MSILDKFRLEGKVALVTGGAGLYGRQQVAAIAEAGAKTYLGEHPAAKESAEKVAADFRDQGLDVTVITFDQADEPSILTARDKILAESGKINILINNAVLRSMKKGYYDEASTFAESMKVNATGVFMVTRAMGDAIVESGGGSIVNISSIQGLVGPDLSIYRGTPPPPLGPDYWFHKGGIINLTRYIAGIYGEKGVRCNCICPGGFQTPDHTETFVRQYSDRTFVGRMGNETDLKGVVVFLSSDAAEYITGAIIPVDGGYTAK